MRLLLLVNNWAGWKIVDWLREHQEQVCAIVVHPLERSKFREEIIAASGLSAERIYEGTQLRDPSVLREIGALGLDMGISAYFGYILRKEFLNLFPKGCVNLHPAYLPYNRGAYPNVWSIVENTPAGATLHFIDEGVDTGDIISQIRVDVEPIDTGATLYAKLEKACFDLFVSGWPNVKSGAFSRTPQPHAGTLHKTADVRAVDEIHPDQKYTARELINLLRARTFPPHKGAFYRDGKKKVYLNLDLRYDAEEHS